MEAINGEVMRVEVEKGSSGMSQRYKSDAKVSIFMTYEELVSEWENTMRKFDKNYGIV